MGGRIDQDQWVGCCLSILKGHLIDFFSFLLLVNWYKKFSDDWWGNIEVCVLAF